MSGLKLLAQALLMVAALILALIGIGGLFALLALLWR